MNAPSAPTRRQRLRQATAAEIRSVARRLLADGGPDAMSVREIARRMGITAGALYRYFPSLDGLVDALCEEMFEELRAVVEDARGACASTDPGDRLREMARAYRRWALAHPSEFALLFGPRPAGITRTWADRDRPYESGLRFSTAFLTEFAALWHDRPVDPDGDARLTEQLRARLGPYLARHGDTLPLPVVFLSLRIWTRLYGLIAMEVFGHLRWALTDAETLFEAELRALTAGPPTA